MMRILFMLMLMVGCSSLPQETSPAVRGTVKLRGRIPARREIKLTPDCAKMRPQGLLSDDLVVDGEGNIQWVFVYVKTGLEGKTFPVPQSSVVLTHVRCRFEPHVFGVQVGQDLKAVRGESHCGSFHFVPFKNRERDFALLREGTFESVTFTEPEVMVMVKDNICGWMGAWIGVLDHPFFAVTDEKGRFEIKGLPPGKYTLAAWHEKYVGVEKEVEVKGGMAVDFELVEKKE